MKRRPIITILSALALAGWPGCSKPGPDETLHEEKNHEEHGEHGGERISLTAEQLANAHLKIEEAAPAKIRTMVAVYGKVAANEEALAHVVPRFAGIVKSVRKRLGDRVERGEVLAQIESNESLKIYDVTSEIAGTVIQKDITLGELVKDDKAIFTVADLGTVWINLSIFRRDFGSLAVGSAVEFHTGDGHVSGQQHIQAKVDYISPFGSEGSQTMLARCVVPNPTGILRPGLYVDGEVVTGEIDAAVTVKNGALQEIEGKTVVFVAEKDGFEARAIEIGVKDNERAEIIAGLRPGEKYVAANSFVMKAELGKGEAEHEH
ncbi:MAG TPA: efflux RND transporter periplasmic adaptor subunit [Chthoniobacterales bacterium]|nr:efflux RND transporter periplasmic adaptor subunit [Chthoniobacterales bacterium]